MKQILMCLFISLVNAYARAEVVSCSKALPTNYGYLEYSWSANRVALIANELRVRKFFSDNPKSSLSAKSIAAIEIRLSALQLQITSMKVALNRARSNGSGSIYHLGATLRGFIKEFEQESILMNSFLARIHAADSSVQEAKVQILEENPKINSYLKDIQEYAAIVNDANSRP
jgi:hypothetical protein